MGEDSAVECVPKIVYDSTEGCSCGREDSSPDYCHVDPVPDDPVDDEKSEYVTHEVHGLVTKLFDGKDHTPSFDGCTALASLDGCLVEGRLPRDEGAEFGFLKHGRRDPW